MKSSFVLLASLSLASWLGAGCAHDGASSQQTSAADASATIMLDDYVNARRAEFDSIDPERRAQLLELAEMLEGRVGSGELPITFICTHNSRRSQMSQVWARIAAERSGVPGVQSFSGGTEVTAFNPRAVEALRRAGVNIEKASEGDNPSYLVHTSDGSEPLECSSKTFSDPSNPAKNFVAVMTCSSADQACPFVPGAGDRFSLTYLDPKAFDGTERETEAYDERCAQIARELLFVFEQVAQGS